jgi:hypothetical protein
MCSPQVCGGGLWGLDWLLSFIPFRLVFHFPKAGQSQNKESSITCIHNAACLLAGWMGGWDAFAPT